MLPLLLTLSYVIIALALRFSINIKRQVEIEYVEERLFNMRAANRSSF